MQVLVTGGAGFIGSRLAERLLADGHEVTVLDNLSAGDRSHVPEEASFIEADIKDRKALDEALSPGFDRVFHLAANADVRTQNQDREKDLQENVVGTHTLLEALDAHGIRDLVFTSSSVVYGEADEIPTPETYPMRPISLYGSSKAAGETFLSTYAASFGFDITVVRLANIIGGRSDHGVTYDFVQKLRDDDSELEVLGNGRQRKSYLHVEDTIDALLHAVETREDPFEVFNVGNTDAVEVSRIAEVVIDAFGCDAEITYTGGEQGWTGDVTEMLLDISRLQDRGWEPSMSSEEAVRRTAEGVIERLGR